MTFRRTVSMWLLVFGAPLAAQDGRAVKPIWRGSSASFSIEWTTANLIVRSTGTNDVVIDLAATAKSDWAAVARQSERGRISAQYSYRLLSVLGPYLSVEEANYCDCGGAHPSAVKRIRAFDLRNSKLGSLASAALTSLFSGRGSAPRPAC